MTIQTTGQISLSDLQIEFGGNDPISLSEYYRGGSFVKTDAPIGSASFQSYPLSAGTLVPIPTGGTIQLSQFYGARSVIIGSIGSVILAPADNDTTSDYVDVPLPAGVDLIRIFLVGAGGGAGGQDGLIGGKGGGGSTLSGTINTAWAGPVNVPRTLRFFIGRGGQPGPSGTGDDWGRPAPSGGHGYGMFGIRSDSWSAWLNNYGVTHENNSPLNANARVTSRSLYFPHTGTYLFEFLADNILSIAVDGVNVADTNGLNDQGSSGQGSYSFASPLTRTVSLTAGHHKVKFTFSNTGSIGAYAARIVNNTTGGVFWTTRDEYSGYKAYPSGGASGYAGGYGASGYGGSGGSSTMLSIISPSGAEYFVALAGGGGGGGGAGGAGTSGEPANVSLNGNWANQGISKNQYSPPRVSGDGGEFTSRKNNGANDVAHPYAADGGGGGGGGGGIVNNRQYVKPVNKQWQYSGFGGRTRRGQLANTDAPADGGESGKSAITSAATLYADIQHNVTTGRNPVLPSNPVGLPPAVLSLLNNFGKGGDVGFGAGWNGAAYVDWGYVGANVTAPAVSRATLQASIIPYDVSVPIATLPLNYSAAYVSGAKTFTLDAFGGGGNPGSEYTYTWSSVSGGASIESPTSYRTNITMGASTGVVRCTVSDGVSQATADWGWTIVADLPTNPDQGFSSCFPAGSMVLMGDGSEQAVETLKVGDLVMGINGPEPLIRLETPFLGSRKLYSFEDGHQWSEEHPHWTRDITGKQWWWSANIDTWLAEVANGFVVGLKDNSTMRTGEGFEFAHMSGWKNSTPIANIAPPDTQLYLPATAGGPIVVNGYLVTGGTNEGNFDYEGVDWDKSRISILALI